MWEFADFQIYTCSHGIACYILCSAADIVEWKTIISLATKDANMEDQLQKQIDQVLVDMENGVWTAEICLEESRQQQPGIYDYLFTDENDFLSNEEKNQLIFLHAILWKIKTVDHVVQPEDIESLEEAYWEENEKANFPYDSDHPQLDALSDEVVGVVLDCTDAEIHELTEVGAEWILIKGMVLATMLK